jgi:NADH:ubiquinone oxidoreductase subunit H
MVNNRTLVIHKKRRRLFTIVTNPKGSKRGLRQFEEISHYLIIILKTKSHDIYLDHLTHTIKVWKNLFSYFNSVWLKKVKINFRVNLKYQVFIALFIVFFLSFFNKNLMFGFIMLFLIFLAMFLQIVFFTTCERKILALTQRRVGPRIVGVRGRLQYFADAIKLLTKINSSPKKVNLLFFQASAITAYWLSWISFSNLFITYGEDIVELEYNIFFAVAIALAFSIAWIVAGWSAVSKYALLGCLRACVQTISYEIIMGGVIMNIVIITGSISFEIICQQQEAISFIFFFPYLAIIGFLATLVETNRPPFDLSEAESDLVAGYTVEYSGILFGLFYLSEYLNLFVNAIILLIIFVGSWWTITTHCSYLAYSLESVLFDTLFRVKLLLQDFVYEIAKRIYFWYITVV